MDEGAGNPGANWRPDGAWYDAGGETAGHVPLGSFWLQPVLCVGLLASSKAPRIDTGLLERWSWSTAPLTRADATPQPHYAAISEICMQVAQHSYAGKHGASPMHVAHSVAVLSRRAQYTERTENGRGTGDCRSGCSDVVIDGCA